ncbi:MAG TPA: type II toxin-antitoxin system PemK/MazF family toxin [Thermoanaerobaculia bacterium]
MMPPKKVYEFGDVVKVQYRGGRPAVVVSAKSHNATALDLVLMQITTKEQHALRSAAVVLDRWADYGLDEPSLVKPVVFSYDVDDVTYIGALDERAKTDLRKALAKIFGISTKVRSESDSSAPEPPSGPTPVAPRKSS